MLSYLLFALGFSFACVVQPGPFQAYLISQSLISGWRKAWPLVFIPLISDIPVIVIVLVILSSIPKEALIVLQLLGGAFLLYLSYKAFQTWRKFNADEENKGSPSAAFFKGLLVNVLNPNAYIGWGLVMGPMLIRAWNDAHINGVVLIAAFYGSMVIFSLGLVFLFGSARQLGSRVTKASIGISAVALGAFGGFQILSGFGIV